MIFRKNISQYETDLIYFSRLILKIVFATIVLVFIANIFLKGFTIAPQLLFFLMALVVSILPGVLPAVVAFALSQGGKKMAKEHVVVKHLSALEYLGNIDVLCLGKTGIFTQNKLSLEKIVTSDKARCFLYGALGATSKNSFDLAVLSRTSKETLNQSKKFNIISELFFDSHRMMSSVLVEKPGERVLIVKGSPENILKRCVKFNGRFTKQELKEDIERQSSEGRRILALAYRFLNSEKIKESDERGLTFLGYFVFKDSLKTTAEEAIKLSKKLGVNIKIITGDSKEVAEYVAKKAGLLQSGQSAVLGEVLEKMPPDEFEDACERESVFARITPSLKHKIVRVLEKRHDVGDFIQQKDLRVIVNGIKDSRIIFSNINKYIKTTLAGNFGSFYSLAVISLFVNFLPMLPAQILLGSLLSVFPLFFIALDSTDIEELKKPKMYRLNMVLPLIIFLALVSVVFDFIFFSLFRNYPAGAIQTLWFIESILTKILLIFVIRTSGKFYVAKRPSIWLIAFAIIDGVFVVALPFLPIGKAWFHFITPPILPLLIIFLLAAVYFATSELVKLIYFRRIKAWT